MANARSGLLTMQRVMSLAGIGGTLVNLLNASLAGFFFALQ